MYERTKRGETRICLINRVSLIALLLLIVIAAVTVAVYFAVKHRNDEKKTVKIPVKFSSDDVVIAARMIEAMDPQADPCEDFYQYACGGWIRSNYIPDSQNVYNRFHELINQNTKALIKLLTNLIEKNDTSTPEPLKKALDYYESCVNTPKIEAIGDKPFRNLLDTFASWPLTNDTWNASAWNPLPVIATIHKAISQSTLFKISVRGDIKNSSVNVLTFEQDGLVLNRDIYLQNTTYHLGVKKAYLKLMKEIVKLLGASATGELLMEEVLVLETQLAEKSMSVLQLRNFAANYESMTLKEYSNRTEIPINWFEEIFKQVAPDTGYKITENEKIVSYTTSYMRDAYKIFINKTSKVQSAYILWHLINKLKHGLGEEYQKIYDQFYFEAFGIKSRKPRSELCLGYTVNTLGFAIAKIFVDEAYDTTAKTASTEMIQSIKEVFKSNLETIEWMDSSTKNYARRKASAIIDNIGYPSYILNNSALEERYKTIVVKRDEYFNNNLEKLKFEARKSYQNLDKPYDKSEWYLFPTDVNAYYSFLETKIVFPAGILQWPFYDKRAPRAAAYGAIGMVVGHEISHGFDDKGRGFTIDGNLRNWWTNDSNTEYQKRTTCFINQYGNFSSFRYNINGHQTLGENVADNGGLGQSFQAYQLWAQKHGTEKGLPGLNLTPEQLYFLSFGQLWCELSTQAAVIQRIQTGVHSINKYRVIGSLQNSEAFSKAYSCPVGSFMNPEKKCRIW